MKKENEVSREQESSVVLALVNGHCTTEAIAKYAQMTTHEVLETIERLNAQCIQKYGEPFVTFHEAQ